MIKSRRIRQAEYVTRRREEECILNIGGKARRKETTRKTKICGWIILKCILER
jgi:hypothetical protein